MVHRSRSESLGTVSAFLSFVIWGVLPIYWRWLDAVPASELIAHRIVWAAAVLVVIVTTLKWREFRDAVRDGRAVVVAMLAGILLGTNWFTYIWAISSDRLVEASLGYYINPLVSVLLGVVFLRERLGRLQLVALGLAAAGVLVLTVSHGRFPWISIALAFSFGTYGLVKKTGRLGSLVGLFVELWLMIPVAVGYLVLLQRSGSGAFVLSGWSVTLLLAGTGIVTVAPLALFGEGARRIPLSRVGFLQYIAPTTMLLIGTVMFGESFTATHAVSFVLIWGALALYSISLLRNRNRGPGAAGG